MKVKTSLLAIFLLLALGTQAASIYPIPTDESDFFTITGLPQKTWTWKCRLIIFCWPTRTLGATITTINATDRITDSRSTINTNFTNLNIDKIEVATSSVGNITTLPNLSSIGTLTTGVWNATAIGVAYGGTGTTTPARYQVILGNGAYGLTVASSTGSTGQFLTSNGAGAYPSWQSSTVSLTDDYLWTGNHFFKSGVTTTGRTLLHTIGIGTTTISSTSLFTIASSTYIDGGGLGIGKPTTTDNNLEVQGESLFIGKILAPWFRKGIIATSTNSGASATSDGSRTTVVATCPEGMIALSGGFISSGGDYFTMDQSYPSASTTWTVRGICNRSGGSCSAGTLRVHVFCIQD